MLCTRKCTAYRSMAHFHVFFLETEEICPIYCSIIYILVSFEGNLIFFPVGVMKATLRVVDRYVLRKAPFLSSSQVCASPMYSMLDSL